MTDEAGLRPQAAAEVDLSGRELGNYRLLRRLGRGAMAEVYLAEQISLRRQVAFKVLRTSLADDESYVSRFHREAQAAASLVHANIVQIHEVGCIEGVRFIAQEYVRGWNLQEFMARRGPPDTKLALRIMVQVAAALRKAAEQGIVHRDIKPENIMLSAAGEVKVADFGLARLGDAQPGTNLTQVGFTMGTPLYMSPEQVEGKPLDPRSDMYSFGVTCYHMLAGEPPFRGDTALAVAVQHLNAEPPPIDKIRPDLPPALCRIVHKMLAKSADDRYASPRDLHREVRALAQASLSGDAAAKDLNIATGDPTSTGDQTHAGELAVTAQHRAATERLATVMRSAAAPAARARWRRWIPLSLAAAFVVGAGLAWATRERPLLPPDTAAPLAIGRKDSAEAQFVYALAANTEEGWKSVGQYFPDSPQLVARSNQQLARYYLEHGKLADAEKLFNEFAASPDHAGFKAFGIAGQVLVFAMQGKRESAADKLGDLWPLRQYLDADMRGRIGRYVRQNNRGMKGKPGAWKDWLERGRNTPSNSSTAPPGGDKSPPDGRGPAATHAPKRIAK